MRAADNKNPSPSPPSLVDDTVADSIPHGYRRRCQEIPMRVESSTMSDPSRGLQRAALGDECLAEVSEGEDRETTLDPRDEPREAEEEMTKSVHLHRELATKRREVSHLVDEMQRLQSSINNLKEMSTCKIAQLQDMVGEKDRVIKDLAEKLLRQQDYSDLKRELRLLQTLDAGNWQSWSSKSVDTPLELTSDDKSEDANGNRLSPTSGEESDDPASPAPSSSHLQHCLRLNVERFGGEPLNTLGVSRNVRELLSAHSIGQRLFAKLVLGLSQGTVSELLSKPKPWDKLTEKGRDSYRKMHAWASDQRCIALLKAMLPRKQGYKPEGEDRSQQPGSEDVPEREEPDETVVSTAESLVATSKEARTSQHAHLTQTNVSYSEEAKAPCHFAELPPVMLSHLYQEELFKLIGKRIKDCQLPVEPTKQAEHEIRQTLALYHRELALVAAHHCHQRGRPAEPCRVLQYGCSEPNCCVAQQPGKQHGGYFSSESMKVLSPYSTGNPLISLAPEGVQQQTIPGCSEDTSPLQRMQSITNSLLVAAGQGFGAQQFTNQRPNKAVLPPITQQQFDHYSNLNTEDIVKRVKEQLSQFSISQRLFGESVLGLSQGSVSDLLARPKPWHMLTQKGREPFIRMQMFLEDEGAVHKLVASQYKIAPERLMRMGGYGGVPTTAPLPMGSNRFSPVGSSSENMYCNPRPQPKVPRPCSPPRSPSAPLSPSGGRGVRGPFVQPSVYEMAAVTTDLDTQVVTARIKETLTVHNIGQKLFGEAVLGLSQGSVSELLSKPKPWHMLSIKGREPFIRMQLWLGDAANVDKLQAIKTERREANKRRRSTVDSESDRLPVHQQHADFLSSKRARMLFSEEQKEALRLAYTLDPYPSTAIVEFLSSELGLSVRTITNWFHNHRMRMKQQNKEPDLPYSNPEVVASTFDPMRFRLLLGQRLAEVCKANSQVFPFFSLSPFDASTLTVEKNTLDLSVSSQQYPKSAADRELSMEARTSTSNVAIDLTDRGTDEPSDFSIRRLSPRLKSSPDMMTFVQELGSSTPVDTPSDTSTPDIDSLLLCQAPDGPVDLREERKVPPTPTTHTASSNRRKPAAPQWVDPGLDLSPDSDIFEDPQDEPGDVINGICVRQKDSFKVFAGDQFKAEQEQNIRRLERAIAEREKGWDEISDDENVC